MAARRVVQLDLLEMKRRGREAVECANMVVMHVGQDHVGDRVAVESDQRQCLGGAAQVPPAARRCDFGSEAGVDYKTTLSTNSGPDEIVHRHRAVMRIAADEMIGTPGVALGIADRIELVFGEMAVRGAVSSVGRVRSEGKDCGGLAAVQA